MTSPKMCWGCGKDYRKRWSESDLSKVIFKETLHGEYTGYEEEILACPDCVDELRQDGRLKE